MANLTQTNSANLLEIQNKATYKAPVLGGGVYKNVGLLIMSGEELNAHRKVTEKQGDMVLVGAGWFNFKQYPVDPDKTYFVVYRTIPDAGYSFRADDGKFVGMDASRLKVTIQTEAPAVEDLWLIGSPEYMAWDTMMAEKSDLVAKCRKANTGDGFVSIETDTAGKLTAKWNAAPVKAA